jgi:hypothetical protein
MAEKDDVSGLAEEVMGEAAKAQKAKTLEAAERDPDLWDRWCASKWYFRAALLFLALSFLTVLGLQLMLDGKAEWGFVRSGHYFVAHRFAPISHEVPYWVWQASLIADRLTLFAIVLALFLGAVSKGFSRRP